jgi:hypothetical protein
MGGDINLDSSYSPWDEWRYIKSCPNPTDYTANNDAFSTTRIRTRKYNKTKEELPGGECPQADTDTDYTKQTENYTCPRDCSGNWKITRQCNTGCPGNALNNNGISTKTSSGGQATQTRTFSIIKSKLGSGIECSVLDGIVEDQTCDTGVYCNCMGGDINLDSSYSPWSDWTYSTSCPNPTDYTANNDAFSTTLIRTRKYNKTKEELPGGKCPQADTDYTKQTENYTCPRDCSGNWKITRQCNTGCPGNALNNNGISTKTSSGEQATQTRTFSIIKSKLGSGIECSVQDGIVEDQTCDTGVDCPCTVERDYKPWTFTNPKCDSNLFTADKKSRIITITKKSGSNTCTFPKLNPNEKAIMLRNQNTSDELQFFQGYGVIQTIETVNNISIPDYCTDYMVPGNIAANMSITNGTEITELTKYRGYEDVSIGTIGFPFYCSSIDYGLKGNMSWDNSQSLSFKYLPAPGELMYLPSRMLYWQLKCESLRDLTRSAYTFDAYTSNNHSIKRFINTQTDYDGYKENDINMEIRFIRGPLYQYIEVNMIYNNKYYEEGENFYWYINSNGDYNYVFAPKDNPTKYKFSSPPVESGGSFVLRSDLEGNNWELFKNYYVKL